jgi:hypothetical protein
MLKIKPLPFLMVILGALFLLAGAVLVIMYLVDGVINRIGEADQSLLFWYLPILFLGFAGITIGWAMGSRGWERLKELRHLDE